MAFTKTRKIFTRPKSWKKVLFYSACISIPILHFLVFYVYINFNSFLLAFRSYEFTSSGIVMSYVGFENFATAWKELVAYGYRIGNSLLYLAISLFVSTPMILLFSFYIYKKAPLHGFFKVMLVMPQVLSTVVFGLIYICLTNDVYLHLSSSATMNLLENPKTQRLAIILFNLIMGLGVNVLMYTSAMSGINQSIVESAQIDGCSPLKEFWHITLPMIFPTIITLSIVTFARVFTDQYNMYTLFGKYANNSSPVGYFLYLQANQDAYTALIGQEGYLSFPVLSAYGLILTAIVMPTTLFLRWLLNKYGPKAD